MSLKRPPLPKLEFYARIWKTGNKFVIPIGKDLSDMYEFEGKFAKVTVEVIGSWRLPSPRE